MRTKSGPGEVDSAPERIVIGWREWVALPGLGVGGVLAKIDTGARSSSLHTHDYEIITREGSEIVRFHLHPLPDREDLLLTCEAPLESHREVKDSGGHIEIRPFIRARVCIGAIEWDIDLNLSNREGMKYRMLLGREALGGFLVDPKRAAVIGSNLRHIYERGH